MTDIRGEPPESPGDGPARPVRPASEVAQNPGGSDRPPTAAPAGPEQPPNSPGDDPARPVRPASEVAQDPGGSDRPPTAAPGGPDATEVAPAPTPGPWQWATVEASRPENAHVVTLRLRVPDWREHLPGQHYVVRLTAEDGYSASRSYSISSPPEDAGVVELTVDRLPDGEVSPYLTEVLVVGDEVEVRGPIGGYFAWRGESPLLLVAGGSGVAPVMSMLRSRRLSRPEVPVRMLFSVRAPEELIFAAELGPETTVVYTRRLPDGYARPAGRITGADIAAVAFDSGPAYVCGSSGFVEAAARLLAGVGYDRSRIRLERYGPSSTEGE